MRTPCGYQEEKGAGQGWAGLKDGLLKMRHLRSEIRSRAYMVLT